ncbi:MAG TPA: TonB-dependent receptor, partial [Caulobacteraceae bacterium]|nr:TonB-dependent receptor [Caulobacteraceae bacterium]
MNSKAYLFGASALVAVASLGAIPAHAATATAAAQANSENAATLGEITVVAEKREENIQRVPVAVTAFSAEQRVLMGIQKVQDLTDFSPGVSWTDTDDRIYIRGIGRNSDNLNNTSGVAFYYNGVYYGANAAIELQKDTLFIGNVEIDNGPQNTLHGSNADGGVINFTSRRPTNSYYAEVRAGVSNYDKFFGEFVVSGPINDHLKFRLGGNYTQMSGGFYHNLDGPDQGGDLVLGGSGDTHYEEAQLEGHWDHFDIWGMVSSGEFTANNKQGVAYAGAIPDTPFNNADTLTPSGFYGLCGLPGIAGSPGGDVGCGTGPAIVPGSVKTAQYTANMFPGNNPGILDIRHFIQTSNSRQDQQRNLQFTVHATYHAPGMDISYLGAYQQFHYILLFPSDAASGVLSYQEAGPAGLGNLTIYPSPAFTLFNEYDQSFSHELDFTSTTDSPLQYVAGLYWSHEHWNQPVQADYTPFQSQMGAPEFFGPLGFLTHNAYQPGCAGGALLCAAPVNPSFAGSTENTDINYDSLAGFGQVSYRFNDEWKVSGALRYTNDHKSGWQEWRVVNFDSILTASSFGALTPALDITALAACGTGPQCEPSFPGAGPTVLNANTGFAERNLGATWGALTGEADVDWTPNPTTLVYAKYSRGYKSGGWSTYTLAPNPEAVPEYVDAFEVGAKKTFGNTLTMNGDAFYYNYYNDQVPLSVLNSINQVVPILYNLPLVHDWGVELWGSWRPIDPLTINLSYSYLNTKIAKSACVQDTVDPMAILPDAKTSGCPAGAAGVQNIVGGQLPEAVPNKLSLNAQYT